MAGPPVGVSPEESGEEARSRSFGNLSLGGDKRWCSVGTRKGSGTQPGAALAPQTQFLFRLPVYEGCLSESQWRLYYRGTSDKSPLDTTMGPHAARLSHSRVGKDLDSLRGPGRAGGGAWR